MKQTYTYIYIYIHSRDDAPAEVLPLALHLVKLWKHLYPKKSGLVKKKASLVKHLVPHAACWIPFADKLIDVPRLAVQLEAELAGLWPPAPGPPAPGPRPLAPKFHVCLNMTKTDIQCSNLSKWLKQLKIEYFISPGPRPLSFCSRSRPSQSFGLGLELGLRAIWGSINMYIYIYIYIYVYIHKCIYIYILYGGSLLERKGTPRPYLFIYMFISLMLFHFVAFMFMLISCLCLVVVLVKVLNTKRKTKKGTLRPNIAWRAAMLEFGRPPACPRYSLV